MASPRIPSATWCPVCQSKDISSAPLDQAVALPGVDATMQTRPWSCRACGALFLMACPLSVSHAPPLDDGRVRPLSSWTIDQGGRVVELRVARGRR